jgi:hypothetical protein
MCFTPESVVLEECYVLLSRTFQNQIDGSGWFRGLRKRYLEKPLLHDHAGAKLSKASLLLPWTSCPQPQHMSGISKKLEQNRP